MLHNQTHGLLGLREQNAILLQVEALSMSNKLDLPQHSRFLLEFDIGRLQRVDYKTQCYWVRAVEAVQIAIIFRSTSSPNPPTNCHNLKPNNRQVPTPDKTPKDSNRTMKPD